MNRIVFAYSSPEAAKDRAGALHALPGAKVKVQGSRVAIILNPVDAPVTQQLLDAGAAPAATWDPTYFWHGESLTLESGIAFAFAGCVLGALIATLLRLSKPREAFPDRSISLDL